eukprot:CAMPEP_0182469730 /NCGR_PEP_ID=MMETSP1319-20130603/17555_1 /TAXON_ID=172717 /ORGANISM="Bolidomonas pacifica, Strain RCC208" /LENGTH=73 /DNA_ID=CAMNT_0024670069 /DNA_START=83 /DNA_END=301 /DNA_ORIENTATION=-
MASRTSSPAPSTGSLCLMRRTSSVLQASTASITPSNTDLSSTAASRALMSWEDRRLRTRLERADDDDGVHGRR